MNSTNGRTITEQEDDEEEHQRNVRFGPSPAKLRAELRRQTKGPSFMLPLVLVGPSGAGKSTIVKYLQSKAPDCFAFSVSSTTRKPREGEVNGVHYHFVTKEDFLADVEEGNFLEHQEVHGNFYGTHKNQVEEAQNQGMICILDIDVKGALEVAQS